jgi:hypothetical protein
LQELCDDHVDVLILLFPPGAEETEVLPSLHTHTLHTGTQAISGHSKVTGRVEKLRERGGKEGDGERKGHGEGRERGGW